MNTQKMNYNYKSQIPVFLKQPVSMHDNISVQLFKGLSKYIL